MRKPREEGRSTRSSGSRPKGPKTQKKSAVTKPKPKAKVKTQPKKQGKDVDRPVQVTVIRVRNPKTTKSILQGGVSKQKTSQKKKTASVVGALKEDLLKKLAENVDDKLTGVVNTLLEVAVVSKKVIPRKKIKEEETVQSPPEKSLKKETLLTKQIKSKKEAQDLKHDVTNIKEIEKKSSKDVKEVEKKVKEPKKPINKDVKEKKTLKKSIPKPAAEKKAVKKTEIKVTGKDPSKKSPAKEMKKTLKGPKVTQSDSKKALSSKKNKSAEDIIKVPKLEKVYNSESKKSTEVVKKESDSSKKDVETKNNDDGKKGIDVFKKDTKKNSEASSKKDLEITKKVEVIDKEEISKKSKSSKDEDVKKSKTSKDEDAKNLKQTKSMERKKVNVAKNDDVKQNNSKNEEIKKTKKTKDEENKKIKEVFSSEEIKDVSTTKAAKAEPSKIVKKPAEKKVKETVSKVVSGKGKPKKDISVKKEEKKVSSGGSEKKQDKEGGVKVKKRVIKKKIVKKGKGEGVKLSQIINTPKRHREASLNALAKVHCLYENESRVGAMLDIIDKSEKLLKDEKKEKVAQKKNDTPKEDIDEEEEEEVEEVPVRNLRTAPGLRSVGRHWDILNATSSSSEDSSDSVSEKKSIDEAPSSPPKIVEKKVKRRRKRSEVVMDLKDMVVKKRMASLNASAMMAATYSTDKRSKSDDDSRVKDSDSRESSSTPEVVDVEETSDDEVILGGRKKALVIVNQDTADLTITGVYVNSTTRSTRHEGFCSISGMQYRISSTSHTQTETAVSTETTVIHTEHGESSSRTGGSDGGSSCKTYTPLGALSSMQPPGSPRYPPSPASSAFTAPPHHHSHPQEMHGYFQPAGPLISSSQLKAGPSQLEEMQGTSSQPVPYTAYPGPPTGYLEPPGYPHGYPKYPPPPPGYPTHRRYYYPSLEAPYPSPYHHPHYYNPYTTPAQPPPPPHYRPPPYMDPQFQPCPCPMQQSCPKNGHTGPLTGTNKGSESNSSVPQVGASRGPVQLNPVALALPPEPNAAVNPPSPARGSAGLPPPASPALAQASWGTPPPPQSPSLLTATEPQTRRKRRRNTNDSPLTLDSCDKVSDEPPEKLFRPLERMVQATEKYERLQGSPGDHFVSDRTQVSDRLISPCETIIQPNVRMVHPSELLSTNKFHYPTDSSIQTCNRLIHDKNNDRLIHSVEKAQSLKERALHPSEKVSAKSKNSHLNEKIIEKSVNSQTCRVPHPSDVIAQTNDRNANHLENISQVNNRVLHPLDKREPLNRTPHHDRLKQPEKLISPEDRVNQSVHGMPENQVPMPERNKLSERTPVTADKIRSSQVNERMRPLDKSLTQERMSRPTERLLPPSNDLPNGHSPPEADTLPNEELTRTGGALRNRSSSRDSTGTVKRRVSVNKRTSRPTKLPSPAVGDTPPKRNSKSPETNAKKACVPVKNGRKKKEEVADIVPKVEITECADLNSSVQLKWSNGWSWRGEPFTASVYIRDDRTEIRKCYPSMVHKEGDIIQPRDCILLKAGSRKNLPFVAKVAALWENPDDGEMMVSLLWYYRPEHTEQGRQPHQPPDEVFASRHKDSNSVACIEDKCYVLTFNEYCRYMKRCRQVDTMSRVWTPVPESETPYPRSSRMPPGRVSRDLIFFCRKVYDFRLSRILKNPC